MKTKTITPENIQRKWYLIDAEGKKLGRMATEIAIRLRGKNKPEFTPNMDLGDFIIVINAAKVRVTGKKATDKIYYRHTGYPGGIKSANFEELIDKKPDFVITKAVKGMLPKGPLGRQMLKKLKVYAGAEHPHGAQNPEVLIIEMD